MTSRWTSRWRRALLVATSAALLAMVGADLLVDRRVRLHALVTVDAPPAAAVLRHDRLALTVTGALPAPDAPDGLGLRAWAPTPSITVLEPGDGQEVALRVENLPLRARLEASGPVLEEGAGPRRLLRFAPRATRHIGFTVPTDAVTFAVLGDTGDSDTFAEALRVAAREGADFLLHAGDLVYEDWQMPNIRRILDGSPLPVFAVRGNHDYRNQRRIDFMRALGPPYYSFTMGGATFVALDNAGDYLPGLWRRSTQYRWWRDMLGVPRTGPLFVVMHKPPFDRRAGHEAAIGDRAFARQLTSDFVQAGVNAVFTGHVHETHLWEQDGIPYVVSGQGMESPEGFKVGRMAWVRVRGGHVSIEQIPIWRE